MSEPQLEECLKECDALSRTRPAPETEPLKLELEKGTL